MDVEDVITRMGGLASRAALIAATSRRDVDLALRLGTVVAPGHGRYALPATDQAAARAFAMNGVLSLTSAALHHGWEVLRPPDSPHVVVPRKRNVSLERRAGVSLHRFDLGPDDTDGIATSRELTLTQCLRQLPDDEALAVADSALRHGEDATLRRVAATVQGAGSARVRDIAAAARPQAANPFESALRAIARRVGLDLEPQVVISSPNCWARPDLVDRARRMVVEADSFAWHGDRAALRRDARRYSLLVADGWIVLRFTWEDVMFDQEYVLGVLTRVMNLVDTRTELELTALLAA